MVKNFGGNKAKGYARKNCSTKKENVLRVVEEEGEVYAQVTKIYGGRMCQVQTLDGTIMNCHIRGNFARPRGKRDNFINVNTWLIVGLREWENQEAKGKTLNCDLLEVYSDADKLKLRNNVTNVNWNKFVANDQRSLNSNSNDDDYIDDDEFAGFKFADETSIEYEELIKKQIEDSKAGVANNFTSVEEEVNVDDI